MRITVSGGTGFLGQHLIRALLGARHDVRLLLRRPAMGLPAGVEFFLWNPPKTPPPPEALDSVDALVHLSGETVNQRWTRHAKAEMRASRIESTRLLVQTLSTLSHRPKVLLSASAIGIYGNRGDAVLTESSGAGAGFLAQLAADWEHEANLARALGMRVHCLRTALVLGLEGGALSSMLPVFRFGAGGRLGSGEQWMSWIHIEDWCRGVLHLLEADVPSGPVNLVAPNPVRNAEFTRVLGKVLRRPAFLAVPEVALRVIFGEMSTALLDSERGRPERLLESGFSFRYPALELALRSLLQ